MIFLKPAEKCMGEFRGIILGRAKLDFVATVGAQLTVMKFHFFLSLIGFDPGGNYGGR
jgi:hypothetical protein